MTGLICFDPPAMAVGIYQVLRTKRPSVVDDSLFAYMLKSSGYLLR